MREKGKEWQSAQFISVISKRIPRKIQTLTQLLPNNGLGCKSRFPIHNPLLSIPYYFHFPILLDIQTPPKVIAQDTIIGTPFVIETTAKDFPQILLEEEKNASPTFRKKNARPKKNSYN